LIFTKRCLKILDHAEKEALKRNKVVYPVHLLMGLLLERTGVCAEFYFHYPHLINIVNEQINKTKFTQKDEEISYHLFNVKISQTAKRVLEIARDRMKHFNQIYINEGHLFDAIISVNDITIDSVFKEIDVSHIYEIMVYPRDMIVSLKNYSYQNVPTTNITFKRANQHDNISLKYFVEREFGKAWLKSVENGFLNKKISIFIAQDGGEIIGFACYDVVRKKKGVFGPMGISFSNRVKGIGYTLLHLCLQEMKEIGYEYAVIGEAGPLEFYEKACGAVVVPIK